MGLIRRLRVGLDIDGVLADFSTACTRRCLARFPHARLQSEAAWDLSVRHGLTSEQVAQLLHELAGDRAFWVSLEPLPTVRTFLPWLTAWANVVLISARQAEHPVLWTYDWLAQWTLPGVFQRLPLLHVPAEDKPAMAAHWDLDVMYEDCPATIEALTTVCPVFAPRVPWTNSVDRASRVTRYDHISETRAWLIDLARRLAST